MKLYWVLSIDLRGSSGVALSAKDRATLSQVVENLMRFFVSNEGLAESYCVWAGDGGFAVFDSETYKASRVLRAAEWFGAYADVFLNKEYLGFNYEGPPRFRIVIGGVAAEMPPGDRQRISNITGWMLDLLLKYEREFGRENFISVWENFFLDLDLDDRKRFISRPDKVKGIVLLDAPVERDMTPLAAMILAAKDKIGRRSMAWLLHDLQRVRQGATLSLHDILLRTFTPKQLYPEILKHVHVIMSDAYPKDTFRVAYAQRKANQLVIDYAAIRGEKDVYNPISIDGPFAAAIAFRDQTVVAIASTKDEVAKPNQERRFNRTYSTQDLERLSSLLCIPVTSDASAEVELRTIMEEKTVEKRAHGVLCIDTTTKGFFSAEVVEPTVKAMESLIVDLSLAELFDELLNATVTGAKND
jgi:hypothetical protein